MFRKIVSERVLTESFARDFAEYLPKTLAIHKDAFGNYIIIRPGWGASLREEIARFQGGYVIRIKNPEWEEAIEDATINFHFKYKVVITLKLQYEPAKQEQQNI